MIQNSYLVFKSGLVWLAHVRLGHERTSFQCIETFSVTSKIPQKSQQSQKHTTIGIRWWSPTQLLTDRSTAYVWQSGRDAQLFVVCGRMYQIRIKFDL